MCAFRLTNQKLVFPWALASQPIKCYFANPISKKEIGAARTRLFCHSVTAWFFQQLGPPPISMVSIKWDQSWGVRGAWAEPPTSKMGTFLWHWSLVWRFSIKNSTRQKQRERDISNFKPVFKLCEVSPLRVLLSLPIREVYIFCNFVS